MDSGAGNDTYTFSRGFGQDLIDQSDAASGKIDAISFGADILPGDLLVTKSGFELYIGVAGTTDVVRVNNHFYPTDPSPFAANQIKFASGATFNLTDTQFGVAGDDVLSGTGADSVLVGDAGNDALRGWRQRFALRRPRRRQPDGRRRKRHSRGRHGFRRPGTAAPTSIRRSFPHMPRLCG